MRAMLLEAPGQRLRQAILADLEPKDDEIVLRVTACAVCRTDLQICRGDIEPRKLPIVPGHQVVGEVVRVGGKVAGWSAGDRAGVAWLAAACGVCESCRAGNENLCPDARFTGWDRDGGYGEMVTARADFAYALPAGFSDVAAAPLLCGGVIGYRALKIAGMAPGRRLGLFGFGASALLSLQVALHRGCEVFVCTRSEHDRSRAKAVGAAWVGGYDDIPPDTLDVAVTFAPAGAVVVAALRSLKRGGTVVVNAIHLDRIPEFPYDLLWWERNLRSVANFTRDDAREFLELAAAIPIETAVQEFALDEANEALDALEAGAIEGAAVLVA
ncbi:MAG: zinc-binding alcohol dehydrogenase family protein [Dehalococcoidia bacterium]|nr:zinc-binding alcohol dehydrogenase family protein [Dehalococcoidia bacterium]